MSPQEAPFAGRPSGCLRLLPAAAAMVVLAPPVAAVRAWRRWRRGRGVRIDIRRREAATGLGPAVELDVEVDVPADRRTELRRAFTEAVVRMAEGMPRRDLVVHLAYRVPTEPEPVVVPVGPLVQQLAERLHLALGQLELAGRTVLWLAMPRQVVLAREVDPFAYDPEAPGEPDRLIERAPVVWAMVVARTSDGPSERLRALVTVPPDRADVVAKLFEAMAASLSPGPDRGTADPSRSG